MPTDYTKLKSIKIEPIRHSYTRRDTMLYALGLGVGADDPVDAGDLKYVYEKTLVALPMQAVTLGAGAMLLSQPEFGINYRMLLHAEAGSGDLLVTMGGVSLLRGDGGFGGKSEGAPKPRAVPADRGPDLQAELSSTLNQALIYRLCGDDPARLRRLDARFTSPVYPGEPLGIEIWNIGAGDASFRVVASDRNVIVQDFGRCEFRV